jgi:decaprenylphospho-beta-D-ribofuranose 2-oxidase
MRDTQSALVAAPVRGVLARGAGRSYGDAAQNAGGIVLLEAGAWTGMTVDPVSGTARVPASLTLGQVIEATLPLGWFPMVVPGTRHVTVGGAIASDIHGKNHHADGSFAEHVPEIELVTTAGATHELLPTGPTAAQFWATAGGMGLTGIITAATLQLRPVQSPMIDVVDTLTGDLRDTMDALRDADTTATYTVAWLDLLGRHRGRGVVSRGEHRPSGGGAGGAGEAHPPGGVTAPAIPLRRAGLLHPTLIRAFNAAYFRAAAMGPSARVQTVWQYFFPLDAVGAWSRLYGDRGMLQYQFVVPDDAGDVLQQIIEHLAAAGVPIYLAVLKRLRDGLGPLAFPIRGWTLAADIPAGVPGAAAALDRADLMVAECGGRVYLAKDARTAPGILRRMYPRLAEWNYTRRAMDPDGLLQSDLARRLGLMARDARGGVRHA